MEFQFDLSRIAREQIVKIDNTLLPVGYQHPDDSELVNIKYPFVPKLWLQMATRKF